MDGWRYVLNYLWILLTPRTTGKDENLRCFETSLFIYIFLESICTWANVWLEKCQHHFIEKSLILKLNRSNRPKMTALRDKMIFIHYISILKLYIRYILYISYISYIYFLYLKTYIENPLMNSVLNYSQCSPPW